MLWLILFWRRIRIFPLLVGGALALLTALPFLVHQIQSGWPVLVSLGRLPTAQWDWSAVQLAWEAITGRSIHALAGDSYPLLKIVPELDRGFHLIGWLALGASVGLLWRAVMRWRAADLGEQQTARIDLVLISWLVVPVVFNVRHSLELHLHFFALVAPAAYLLIGRATGSILSSTQTRATKWYRFLAIAGASVLGVLAVAQVLAIVLMGRFVATHDTPGGVGVPLARYLDIANQAVKTAQRTGSDQVLVVGQGDSIVVDPVPAIFDVLLREKVAYRFVDGESAAVFPATSSVALLTMEPGEAAEWYSGWPTQDLQDSYRLVRLDGSWPEVLPWTEEPLEPITGPRTFQNGVEMQQYAWESGSEGSGRIWLQWQVLWLGPDDTHFYVQVVDQEEHLWGQQDSAGYPTESRQKGDRILSKFDIKPGEGATGIPHMGRAGLYLYPQVVNVPVIDQAGNPVTDSVLVGPLDADR